MRESWKRAIPCLKPNLSADEQAPAMSLSHEDSPVLRDLHNGLLVAYLVDEGSTFSYLQNRHLIVAGIDEDVLHKTAIDNLYSLAESHLRIQPHGHVFAVFMEGNFEASVLLLDTVWDVSLKKYVRSEFVAAIPARDVLAFGDSTSPETVAELRDLIQRLRSKGADHPISESLYRRINRAWQPTPS